MLQSFWTNFVGTQSLQIFCVFFEKAGLDEELCEDGLHQLGVSNRALEKPHATKTLRGEIVQSGPQKRQLYQILRGKITRIRIRKAISLHFRSHMLAFGLKIDHIVYNVQLLKVGLVRGHGKWWQTWELKLNHLSPASTVLLEGKSEFTAGSPKFSIDRSMSHVSSQLSIAGGPLLQRGWFSKRRK